MDMGASSYRLFLNGDEKAFEAIVKEYRDPLTLFINSYVHDIHTAEDIAIDVFAYVAVNTHKYNFKVTFKTYLYMLGRSRALDHIRRRSKHALVSLEDAEGYIPAESSPEEEYLQNERRRAVREALDGLPENMRSAVYLVYFENMSYEEAARVMKTSKKQIDNLLYRAKDRLRSVLGEEDEQK